MPKQDFHLNMVEICRKEKLIPSELTTLFNEQAKAKKDLIILINKTIPDKKTSKQLIHALDYARKFFEFCKGMLIAWNKASPKKKNSFHISEPFLLSLDNYSTINMDICDKLKGHVPELALHFNANPKLISKYLESCAKNFGFSRLRIQAIHRKYLEFEAQIAYA